MAGTIVCDTIQDGAGNSTATDNAIYGSAKAWVNFGYVSSAITVRASYNVSSVTRTSAGNYSVTFTNALTDANYCITGTAFSSSTSPACPWSVSLNSNTAPTSSTAYIVAGYGGSQASAGYFADCNYISVAFIR
jgi:hypothetical protein